MLKRRLDSLRYCEPLGFDSAALVERLLNDLLKTTEGFQQLKRVSEEHAKRAAEAQEAVLPLQRETQRLTKQNNDLHLELMHLKEETDAADNKWRASVKRLEGELTDLRFLLETAKQKQKKTEVECAQTRDRLESLQSRTYVPSAQKGVKDPLLPRGETNVGGRAQAFETSGPLEAPGRSSSGAPGRAKANEEWASELREADERSRRFQEEAEKWSQLKTASDQAISRLQEQVSNRDQEIIRLSELVLTKPNTEQVYQRYRQETSEQNVTKLNERMDFLNGENTKLEEQLKVARAQLAKVSGLLQENESLVNTVADLKAKNQTLRRRVEEVEQTGTELEQGQVDARARKEADELRLRNEELRNKIDTLSRELKRAREDQARNLQTQAAYNSDKKAFMDSLERLNSEKTALQASLAEAQSLCSQLQTEAKTQRDSANSLQIRLSNLTRELELNQQSMSRVNKDHLSTAEESLGLRQRISALEAENALLQGEVRDVKFELERTAKMRAAAEEQLSLLRGDSFKSKTELDSHAAGRQRLQIQLEGTLKELQLVKDENSTLTKLREKDRKALLDADRRVQDNHLLLQNAQENVRVVQKEHQALSEELGVKLEEVRRLEGMRAALERELAELRPLKGKWQEGMQDRQRLQTTISDKDFEQSQKRKEIEELRDNLRSKENEVTDLRRQLDRLRAEKDESIRLLDEHDRKSAAFNETAKKMDYLESDLDMLKGSLDQARENERRVVRELEQLRGDLGKASDKNALLQKAVDRATGLKEEVEKELAQARTSTTLFVQKETERESEKIRLEEKSFQAVLHSEDLRRQLTQEQKARSELEDDLSRLRRKNDADQVNMQRLTEQNAQLKTLVESVEKARDELFGKLKLHQQDRTSEEGQRSQLLQEITALRQEIDRKEEELQDLRASLQAVDKDRDYVHSLLDEKTELVSGLQATLSGRSKEVSELKEALGQQQARDASQSHRLDERDVEVRRLTDRVQELQRQVEELRALAAQRSREVQTLQEDLRSVTRENQQVSEQLVKLTQDRDRVKATLDEVTKSERIAQQLKRNTEREKDDLLLTYRKACEENERLSQSVHAFKDEHKDQYVHVQALEQDLQAAMENIQKLEGDLEACIGERNTLERQVSTLTLQLQSAERRVQEAVDAKNTLYSDVSGARHFSQTLESARDDLQRKMAQLESDKLTLENKLKYYQNEGTGARSQIEYERKRYQDLERVLAAERDSRLKLQAAVERADDERIKLTNDISRLQTSGNLQSEERALREENGKLKHLLFKSETKVRDLEQELAQHV